MDVLTVETMAGWSEPKKAYLKAYSSEKMREKMKGGKKVR